MPRTDAIIFVRDSGSGSVTDSAAALLGVPAGEHRAADIENAIRALAQRATNAAAIIADTDSLLADPAGSVVDWTWFFEGDPQRLRVDVTPVVLMEQRGRVWNFRDLTAKLQAIDDEYERLNELQEQFRVIAEGATDFVFVSGPDRRIEWVSAGLTPTLGWSASEMVDHNFIEFIHPDDYARYDTMRDAIRSGALTAPPEGFTFRIHRKDGAYRWMSVRLESVRDDEGVVQRVIVGLRDIDALIAMQQSAEEDRTWVRTVLDVAFDPHVVLRAVRDSAGAIIDFEVTEANLAAGDAVGIPSDALIGRSVIETFADAFGPEDLAACAAVIATGEPLLRDDARVQLPQHGGRTFRFDVRAVKIDDSVLVSWADKTLFYEALDATAAAERELDRRARFDALTGLPNRGEFLQRLEALVGDRTRAGDAAVLFCDVDRFKEINDTFGHAAGDVVLRTLADRITDCLRESDLAARFAGDEFCVLAPRIRRLDDGLALAETIREAAARPVRWNDRDLATSLSIGVELIGLDRDTDAVIAAADRAMYAAKRAGRNRVSPAASD